MSTDKLQALHKTVAEILSEPPSPPGVFDEEPDEAAQASEQITKASDDLRRGTEISKESFGKATSREFGIAPKQMHDTRIVRAATNEIPAIARQALAEQNPVAPPVNAGNPQRSKLRHEAPGSRLDPLITSISTVGPAVSGKRTSLGRWALLGIAGILLAASIGASLITWLGWSGDAAKTALTAPPQPVPLAPTAATLSPELTSMLQSMARDLAGLGKEVEQLKAGRELMVRENANLNEQFRASQEQLTRAVAQFSEQLKASQE
ncbi:MAG: hypothetical protein Q7N95_15405, partial [Alphaproteobacteria bacterium]|nr:hypothetical protein [Alphaproteobacteria bacterium]